MPVTQKDVADVAGVSRRTVSNVINDFIHVSPDVRTRVEDAIQKLGYTPSRAAQTLRTGRSKVIQLVVPELDVPYFAELARGVLRSAEDFGFTVLISQTLDNAERELEALTGVTSDYAEGTILSASSDVVLQLPASVPVVLVGERRWDRFDHVGIDDVAAARVATDHLVEIGRRRIAFIGADPFGKLKMAAMRHDGYAQSLANAGIPEDPRLIAGTNLYHREDGARAFRELIDRGERPDAVFCATDLLAFGAMSAAAELGFSIPGDIAFVGFDNLDEGRFFIPGLSTIGPDKALVAHSAVEALVSRLSNPADHEVTSTVLPFEFIARGSTGF